MYLLTAILAFYGVSVAWDFAAIAALRFFGVKLPLTYAFRFFQREDLIAAVRGKPKRTYSLVSFLLVICPVMAGFIVFDFIEHRYYERAPYGANHVVGLVVVLAILAIASYLANTKAWRESLERGATAR
jgi:hypothetical protein